MKIIIAPDKFKGSLTSFEVSDAILEGLNKTGYPVDTVILPMSDGGDGFAAVLKHYWHTATAKTTTTDPLGRTIPGHYEWEPQSKTAIIEMAVASGLVLLDREERNPLLTSTYGTGLLIQHALDAGARKIVLGLGGSATNDAGTGVLAALGFTFIHKNDDEFIPTGGTLIDVQQIIPPVEVAVPHFVIACDVRNVLFGEQGAAYIYGPQKGADEGMIKELDNGLRHIANVIQKATGKDVASMPGSGAAGGIAAGLMAYFDTGLVNGISLIKEAAGIDGHIENADLLITGEGKIDEQSNEGKVVGSLAALAAAHHIPCVACCGITNLNDPQVKALGIDSVIMLQDESLTKEEAMANAATLLTEKTTLFFKDRLHKNN